MNIIAHFFPLTETHCVRQDRLACIAGLMQTPLLGSLIGFVDSNPAGRWDLSSQGGQRPMLGEQHNLPCLPRTMTHLHQDTVIGLNKSRGAIFVSLNYPAYCNSWLRQDLRMITCFSFPERLSTLS